MSEVNISEVLGLVNKARKALGMESLGDLPKGWRANLCRCPIALALSNGHKAEVTERRLDLSENRAARAVAEAWGVKLFDLSSGLEVELPKEIKHFIRVFDNGELPQYEEA